MSDVLGRSERGEGTRQEKKVYMFIFHTYYRPSIFCSPYPKLDILKKSFIFFCFFIKKNVFILVRLEREMERFDNRAY